MALLVRFGVSICVYVYEGSFDIIHYKLTMYIHVYSTVLLLKIRQTPNFCHPPHNKT